MANANTLSAVYNLSLGNVTAETAFPAFNPIGGSTKALGTQNVRAVVAPPISPASTFDQLDGRPIRLFASFVVTAGGSLNTTLKVYLNLGGNTNQTTLTNDTLVYSTGTMASGGAKSGTVTMSHILIWDSVQQAVNGFTEYVFKGILAEASIAIVAPTILGASSLTTTTTATEALAYGGGFFATALFGTSNTANAVILKELSLCAV